MSENYEPDPEATATSSLTTVFLSQRDLGLQVPINFVTQPGVSFSAACFPFQKYEDDSSGDCLSNLLAGGFRRFEIDLYWDQGRQVWSFCPVAIPTFIPNAVPSSTATLTFSTSTRGALTSDAEPTTTSVSTGTGAAKSSVSGIDKRQTASDASSISTDATSTVFTETVSGTSLGTSLPSLTVLPDSSNTPLVEIGPFICTTTINLSTFTSQLNDYFEKTETTLGAHLIYVIMNLHAAASENDPTAPAPIATTLPDSSNMLGQLYSANLSAFMYTPSNLRADRANLNSSWYTVKENYRPVQDYYSVERTATGIVTTSDGWPSESFIEFSRSKRLLLGFGNSDPQMAAYNFTGDENTIFSSGYIQNQPENITASTSGQLTNGCYVLNATDDRSTVNSSWATTANIAGFDYATTSVSSLTPTLNLSSNLTNCGISPILNVTLLDATADDNYIPYQNFSYSTIWSWAPDEPKNFTASNTGTDSLFRCATANLGLSGRWVVQDCSQKYYASCRADGQPYNWTLTTYPISYSFAQQACPNSYKFAAPRTALENAYLSQAMKDSRRDFGGRGAWVDFNSLDVKGCWTMGGPNATCPYSESVASADDLRRRTILIPTVAAIVVLIITALTVFAKAAGNRRTKRRKTRRVHNGFIYEGVPS